MDTVKKLAQALRKTPMVPPRTTQLGTMLEHLYQNWSTQNNVPQSNDYDMRGFYLGQIFGDPAATSGMNLADGQLHFSDKWKLPNHPKFSNESMYSRGLLDPRWVENPAPYREGTWGLQGPRGLLQVEIPE
jgi:hypothetical protein